MTDQIKKGANKDEVAATANVEMLCRIFGLKPKEFGLVCLDGHKVRSTYETTRILSQLLIDVLARQIENPPNLEELSAEIPMAEHQLPA